MGIEIEFLPIGADSGDAIVVREGNALFGHRLHLIDGGYASTSDSIIEHIKRFYGPEPTITHMVLSHADDDHATGLIKVLEHFHVENLWMNRPWNFVSEVVQHFHGNYSEEGLYRDMRDLHPYLIEMEEIVAQKNRNSLFQTAVHDALQGAQIGSFRVLAPSRQRYVSLIPDLPKTPKRYADSSPGILSGLFAEAKKAVTNYVDEKWDIETLSSSPQPQTGASNESSVVQMAVVDNERFLLTGDVGPDGLNEAADYATLIGLMGPLRFMQVSHHGSRHRELPDHADLQRFWLPLLSAVAGASLRNRFGIARYRARHIPDLSERGNRFSILASASGDGPRAEILNASPGAVGPASRLTASLC